MMSNDDNLVLVFNGEIYNYIELREELKSNYHFKTQTDSEVILGAYSVWGEKCLHRFNGMFSFVIYDRNKDILFGARDRFGVKPFYYSASNGQFVFASEIPPILTVLPKPAQVNEQVMYDFLAYNRTDQNNETFFKGIFQLPHGHQFYFSKGELKVTRWYDPRSFSTESFSTYDQYRQLFESSVALRLRSDVPVGICLSGGLDSAAITSVCSRLLRRKDLETFSAVYGPSVQGDEKPYIDLLRDEVKAQNFVTPTAEEFLEDLKPFVKAHAEPVPTTSPYAQYKVMQLASKKVVVTLDGQGSDEQLAGYHYFFGFYFKELLTGFRILRLVSEVFHYLRIHRSLYGIKTFFYFLLPRSVKERYEGDGKKCIDKQFRANYASGNRTVRSIYSASGVTDAGYGHFEHKLEHLLKWSDRNSMRFSVESRAPFLDYRLVERTLATKSSLKIYHGVTKHLLREALKGILPEKIRTRQDKVGFETPSAEWFRHEKVRRFVEELIQSDTFKNRQYFNDKEVSRIFELHQMRKGNYAREIWKWINVELWCREFIDQQNEPR
jgi:asparagine synthase (glutamine-hydrolysing)